ncbi:hypothetical protein FKM82_028932 [Ascaphus truei]
MTGGVMALSTFATCVSGVSWVFLACIRHHAVLERTIINYYQIASLLSCVKVTCLLTLVRDGGRIHWWDPCHIYVTHFPPPPARYSG